MKFICKQDTTKKDYINDYVDVDPNLPPPPPKDYKYEFEESSSETASEPKSLAEMGKQVSQIALENSEVRLVFCCDKCKEL